MRKAEPRPYIPIPPSIAAMLDALFCSVHLVSPKEAASAIGISDTWLRSLGDRGKIGFFQKGDSHRLYAREHIETFFRGEAGFPSTDQRTRRGSRARPISCTTSKSRSLAAGQQSGFTAAQARKRAVQQRHMKTD